MYKKLNDEMLVNIMENGIDEFVEKGFAGASMKAIAGRSGVSVGVIYKYFEGKDGFFMKCLEHSLDLLDQVLREAAEDETDISECIRKVVRALVKNSKIHSSYNAMYHEITSGGFSSHAEDLAGEIEKRSAQVYRSVIENARKNGEVHSSIDPGILAFFFDNLLMMLQFSGCCDYYQARMALYQDGQPWDASYMETELLKFLESAFTWEQTDIIHRDGQ